LLIGAELNIDGEYERVVSPFLKLKVVILILILTSQPLNRTWNTLTFVIPFIFSTHPAWEQRKNSFHVYMCISFLLRSWWNRYENGEWWL